MRRRRTSILGALLGLVASLVSASALDEAWTLYSAGDLAGAEAALSGLLAAAEGAERAEVLSLAGTVAAARGDLPGARRLWTEAAELSATTLAGREATAKLDLLCAMGGCPEEGEVETAVAPTPDPVPAAPVAEPSRAAPVASARAAAPAAPSSTTVLVAGQGVPFDAVREATRLVTDFLRRAGVDVQSPTEEIAVVHASEVVLAQLLGAARDRGGATVLLLDARFGHRERAEVTCRSADGAVLWSEEVTGGTGLVRPVVMNRNLMERLTAKLAARVGGPGLPTGLEGP